MGVVAPPASSELTLTNIPSAAKAAFSQGDYGGTKVPPLQSEAVGRFRGARGCRKVCFAETVGRFFPRIGVVRDFSRAAAERSAEGSLLHIGIGADSSVGDPLVDVGGEDGEGDAA